MPTLPIAEQRTLDTPYGKVIGAGYSWPGGQYCAIHTGRGIVGCGIFDIECAAEFGMAVAIAKGTPQNPLKQPEDLYQAKIVAATPKARELGIVPGMTGMEALAKLLAEE